MELKPRNKALWTLHMWLAPSVHMSVYRRVNGPFSGRFFFLSERTFFVWYAGVGSSFRGSSRHGAALAMIHAQVSRWTALEEKTDQQSTWSSSLYAEEDGYNNVSFDFKSSLLGSLFYSMLSSPPGGRSQLMTASPHQPQLVSTNVGDPHSGHSPIRATQHHQKPPKHTIFKTRY